MLKEIRITVPPIHFDGAYVIISDALDECLIAIAPAREGSSVAPEVRMLVENSSAIILVDLEGAGFVIPVVPNIAPAASIMTSCSIPRLPSSEASMLEHVCHAMFAKNLDRADVIVLYPASERSEVVVANVESSSATTEVRVLVQDGSAFPVG